MARWTLVCLAVVVAAASLAPAASAVIVPGPNGPLVFTSGRDAPPVTLSDGRAQIWFLSGPNGSATRLTTLGLSHHRHASWSPDRRKIAYARGPDDGTPFDGPWDIFVQDLTNPGSPPLRITNSALNEDRPTWSPDGTKLAYAKQIAADRWDVVTQASDGEGGETTIAQEASVGPGASGQFSRPQWSTDGEAIFYGRTAAANTYDIYRAASNGSQALLGGVGIVTGATNDYQPSLSADGTRLCFTRQGANKDVYLVPSTGGTATPLFAQLLDQYECAWSPDGTRIAYVEGAFGAGQILVRNTDGSGFGFVTNDLGNNRFDGNPEWTYNPVPDCVDGTASVAFNSFVQITLTCTDAPDPLSYDVHGVFEEIATPPENGVLGALEDEMVIYTPNVNFRGGDSFTFRASDGTSDSSPARIDITVGGPGAGGGGPPGSANVTALSVSPRRFRRGTRLPTFSQTPIGTTIGVTLSARGRVALTFRRARPGRRVRGRCVRPTRRNRNRRRCRRYVRAGTLSFNGRQGANTVRFQGRLNRRRTLPIGRYRLSATVTANGRTSPARAVSFRIVRR